jgi:hypothetical protein
MDEQLEIKESPIPIWVKMCVLLWMVIVIFVYLLLFGPPEFWSILDRLGLGYFFRVWRDALQPFLTAGYLE